MEKLLLQEAIILKKIENFHNDLSVIRAEIEFLRKFPENQQKDISSPSSSQSKDEAIPEQTTSGKESTNPLKAVALPKSKTEVQTSLTLVKPSDLNLRPNGGIQIPHKTEGQTSAVPTGYKAAKAYYVVFNGPYPGIYISWEIAEQAIKGYSDIRQKRYKDFDEAKAAANIYTTEQMKPPLALISSSEGIRPYQKALLKVSSNKKVLGNIPKGQQQELLTEESDSGYPDYEASWINFDYLYKMARRATEKDFANYHYFTSDKANVSYLNCYPNTDPELVYEAYYYGLLNLVYPSKNLLEISLFSEEFKNAVKHFRKKCLKGDKDIFIKFISTISFWEEAEPEDNEISNFWYVQIGAIKEKSYIPSKAMDANLEKHELKNVAEQRLILLISKIFSIKREDKVKVNLATHRVLMTSFSHKGISQEDWEKIEAFRKKLIYPFALGNHSSNLCKKKEIELKKNGYEYSCQICGITKEKDSTTKEEDKDKLSKAAKKAAVEN